jgi:hypothetical protein
MSPVTLAQELPDEEHEMDWMALVKELPDALRKWGQHFIRAFRRGDIDHADELIELAHLLERSSPEGRAFVEAFCQAAVEM